MLKIRNLSAYYGSVTALSGVTCHVREGEIVTLIGANGAGQDHPAQRHLRPGAHKTARSSFRRAVASPAWPRRRIVGLGISQVPEGRQLFAPMTVAENLELGAYRRYRQESRAAIHADLERVFQLFPRLKDRLAQQAGTMSGGEQQMLAIGRALMARPRLLLLDEPSLGLAPMVVEDILARLSQLRAEGVTILLVEQNARAALKVADRAYVLETGRIILSGSGRRPAPGPPGDPGLPGPGLQGIYRGQVRSVAAE